MTNGVFSHKTYHYCHRVSHSSMQYSEGHQQKCKTESHL